MNRRVVVYICVVIIVLSGIGVGLYFGLRKTPARGTEDINLNQMYYINEMRNGLFRYPDATGMPTPGTAGMVSLVQNDRSYCQFENDFKIFHIYFTNTSQSTDFIFVVQKIKRSKGSLTATVQLVYNGDICTYKITTTPDMIILTSVVTYKVTIASGDFSTANVEDVSRADTIVMTFSRTKPSYLGGA